MSNVRTDTAVVGPIQEGQLFFPYTLISRGNVKDVALACTTSTRTATIQNIYFVQASSYFMLTDTWSNSGYMPVLFQGLREPSGSFSFVAINDTTTASGILGTVTSNGAMDMLAYDTSGSNSTNFVADPVSNAASQYPTNLLLTAVPYNLYDTDGNTISISIVPSTGVASGATVGGLATGTGTVTSSTAPILFLPASYFISKQCGTNTTVPSSVDQIFGSVQFTQCVMTPGTSYAKSVNCNPLLTGFTKQDDCNQGGGMYAYCNSATQFNNTISNSYCGSGATYTNLLTGLGASTSSCRGYCGEGWCLTTNGGNSTNGCILTSTSNGTHIPWWIVWTIIGLLIIILVIFVLVFIFVAHRRHTA